MFKAQLLHAFSKFYMGNRKSIANPNRHGRWRQRHPAEPSFTQRRRPAASFRAAELFSAASNGIGIAASSRANAPWRQAKSNRWMNNTMPTASPLSEQTVLALSDDVTVQELGETEGGVVLNLRSGEMYTINDTAVTFLQNLDGQLSIGLVADKLVDMFDVPRDVLVADLMELGEQLGSEGLISAR